MRTMEGTKVGSLRGGWRERRWGGFEDDGGNEGGENSRTMEGTKAMEETKVGRE